MNINKSNLTQKDFEEIERIIYKNGIDYYGKDDNYIHLKFGDCVKAYNFTKDFRENYPKFVKAYEMYWDDKRTAFKNPFEVVSYVFNNKIPVHFYYNYTDQPVKERQEIIDYLLRESDIVKLYDYMLQS